MTKIYRYPFKLLSPYLLASLLLLIFSSFLQANDELKKDIFQKQRAEVEAIGDFALSQIVNIHASALHSKAESNFSSKYEREHSYQSADYVKYSTQIIDEFIKENDPRNEQQFNIKNCILIRDLQVWNDINLSNQKIPPILMAEFKINRIYLPNYQILSSKKHSTPFKVVCFISSPHEEFFQLYNSLSASPSAYDIVKYLKYSSSSSSSSSSSISSSSFSTSSSSISSSSLIPKTETKTDYSLLSLTDFISEEDIFPACKAENTNECTLKNIISHTMTKLLDVDSQRKLKIPSKYKKLLELLHTNLVQFNNLDINRDFDLATAYYEWIFDLLAGILSVSQQPLYKIEQFESLMKKIHEERLPNSLKEEMDNGNVLSYDFLVQSGMDAINHAIMACGEYYQNREILPLGKSININSGFEKAFHENAYFEFYKGSSSLPYFSDIDMKNMKLSNKTQTVLLGHSSLSMSAPNNWSAKEESDRVEELVKIISDRAMEIQNQGRGILFGIYDLFFTRGPTSPNFLTVIVDKTLEFGNENDISQKVIDRLTPLIKEGYINLILIKSLQKFANLGTGKTKGGFLSFIFKGNDKRFEYCIENIMERTKDYNDFRKGVEAQFIMHLMNANLINHKDDLALTSIASRNAQVVTSFYQDQKRSKRTQLAPIANGPFVIFPPSDRTFESDHEFPGFEPYQVGESDSFGFLRTSRGLVKEMTRTSMGIEPANQIYQRLFASSLIQMSVEDVFKSFNDTESLMAKDFINNLTIKSNEIMNKLKEECRKLSLQENLYSNEKKVSIINYVYNVIYPQYTWKVYQLYCNNNQETKDNNKEILLPKFFTSMLRDLTLISELCAPNLKIKGTTISDKDLTNYNLLKKSGDAIEISPPEYCSDLAKQKDIDISGETIDNDGMPISKKSSFYLQILFEPLAEMLKFL